MISHKELCDVLNAVVPLYVAMLLAYVSVKRFGVFTAEQCSGINRFVAVFAVPLLSFDFISRVDPFRLRLVFLSADSLSKLLVLLLLFCWSKLFVNGSLDWSITIFSLATLPNTLVMGVPLLKSMYGEEEGGLLIQLVVVQSMLWYTLLLLLFEYRAALNAVVESVGQEIPQIVAKVAPQFEEEEQSTQSMESTRSCAGEDAGGEEEDKRTKFVRRISLLRMAKMVFSKLIRNLNFHAALLAISWALISSRWNVKKPLVMENSITLLSNAGLGMAMFSLGLFMAMQPSIMPCGKRLATYSMLIRFVVGPAVMAMASLVLGIRGTTLKVAIVQAALPQGIVPFVFAKEYDLHSEILSTAVIFGMIVSFPITVFYYIILGS